MRATRTSRLRGAVATALLAGCALPPLAARADPVWFTVNGIIAEGIDGQGMFGAAGASLAGQAYSMTLTLDSDLLATGAGADAIEAHSQPGVQAHLGGVLHIGSDHAYGWGNDASQAWMSLASGNHAALGAYGDAGNYRFRAINDVFVPGGSYFDRLDFDQVIRFDRLPPSNRVATEFSDTYLAPVPPGGTQPGLTVTTWFVGTATSATWGVSPVPEPGRYGMLLAGAGVLGLALRRRGRA